MKEKKDENEQQQKSLTEANQVITENTMWYNCSVNKINHFKSLMKLYNGLHSRPFSLVHFVFPIQIM